jgi:glutamate carboxypeptidase
MSFAEDCARSIASNEREALERLERLVRQNSFSANLDGLARVAELLSEELALPGLALERIAGDGTGDHLVWRTPAWATGGERRVLLVGHYDTVFPPGTFERWEQGDERVRGPGTLDMKGGLIVVRAALAALAEAGALTSMPLALVAVGDEEIGSRHSRTAVAELARGARAAMVFESGRADDVVVTRRKGTGALSIAATGKAAHAGNNHAQGVNAIWALARMVDAVQRLTDYDAGLTVNVGTIKGGETNNTVPAAASCGVDFRYVSAAQGDALRAAIADAARRIGAETGATIEVTGGVHRPPLERTAASGALYETYARRAVAAGLGGGEAGLIGGGSDANNISALGVACIDGLGPRGKGFHTHDEYIEWRTIVPRAQALVATLLDLFPPARPS